MQIGRNLKTTQIIGFHCEGKLNRFDVFRCVLVKSRVGEVVFGIREQNISSFGFFCGDYNRGFYLYLPGSLSKYIPKNGILILPL